jgi:hypothetical protein
MYFFSDVMKEFQASGDAPASKKINLQLFRTSSFLPLGGGYFGL